MNLENKMLSKKLLSLKENSDDGHELGVLSDEALELENIAYIANCFFQSEAERNFGDAEEWKFRLKQAIEKYNDRIFSN